MNSKMKLVAASLLTVGLAGASLANVALAERGSLGLYNELAQAKSAQALTADEIQQGGIAVASDSVLVAETVDADGIRNLNVYGLNTANEQLSLAMAKIAEREANARIVMLKESDLKGVMFHKTDSCDRNCPIVIKKMAFKNATWIPVGDVVGRQ